MLFSGMHLLPEECQGPWHQEIQLIHKRMYHIWCNLAISSRELPLCFCWRWTKFKVKEIVQKSNMNFELQTLGFFFHYFSSCCWSFLAWTPVTPEHGRIFNDQGVTAVWSTIDLPNVQPRDSFTKSIMQQQPSMIGWQRRKGPCIGVRPGRWIS